MIYLVHGYNHDPAIEAHDPGRAGGHFEEWEQMLQSRESVRFPWHSGVKGRWRDILCAWRGGYGTTYGWAYGQLAMAAARRLARAAVAEGRLVDVLCHSLGARVALQAVALVPAAFRRVLILNGAETVDEASRVFRLAPRVRFLNLGAGADDVVRIAGGIFAPPLGYDRCLANGIGGTTAGNVLDLMLDAPATRRFYQRWRGWDLRGDNPRTIGDHSYSFRWPGNWPLIRAFLDGEEIETEKAGLGPAFSLSAR